METREQIEALLDHLEIQAMEAGDVDAVFEIALLRLLLVVWWESIENLNISEYLLGALTGSVTRDELEVIQDVFSERLGRDMASRVGSEMSGIIRLAYGDAAGEVIAAEDEIDVSAAWSFDMTDVRAIRNQQEHSVYWVGTYYDRLLSQRVDRLTRRALEERMDRRKAGAMFREELGALYGRSEMYWRGFAATVITRTRELGRIAGYEQSERLYAQISAVRDRRTSEQCNFLDGRLIRVSDLARWRDQFIALDNPEAVKDFAPWRTEAELEQLVGASRIVPPEVGPPPYHFHCRTRTIASPVGMPEWRRAAEPEAAAA